MSMKKGKIKNAAWYPNAVAIAIGVVLFVFLWKFPEINKTVRTFVGFFKPIIIGCAIAYIINPLSNAFARLFKNMKSEKTRKLLSNTLAFVVVVLFLIFAFIILTPQLIKSAQTFVNNLSGYTKYLGDLSVKMGVSESIFNINALIDSSEKILSKITEYITNNMDSILSASANAGKNIFQWGIAFMLSIYIIAEKAKLKAGFKRLLKAVFGEKRYVGVSDFLRKCDKIFNRYIVYSIIDAIIIGGANAVFMALVGMEYVGLTSFVVAITNLIPTFGPMIGGVIGAFILLITNPMHALIFIVFTFILQTLDGYVIKPRLFGNSLGVSGLWILVGIIVGGNMFGVLGILLAIPSVAVIDLIYNSYLIPALENRRKKEEAEEEKVPGTEE